MHRAQAIYDNIKAAMSAHDARRERGRRLLQRTEHAVAKHADLSEMESVLDGVVGKLESMFKIESTEETKLGGWDTSTR